MRVGMVPFHLRGAIAVLVFLPITTGLCAAAQAKHSGVQIEDRKSADDHVTEGWVLTYDNPDPDRGWQRIAGTLVIARHGKVVRRWDITTVRRWAFWNTGHEVVYEVGGLHGPADCIRMSVDTGKRIAAFSDCTFGQADAPDWVKALEP
jgi:hypothetical protein